MNFKTVIFFLSHTYINSAFSTGILFPIASSLFLSNQTHIVKIPFLFLETQSATIDSIYGLLLLSRVPHDSIDTAVSLSLHLTPHPIITTSKGLGAEGKMGCHPFCFIFKMCSFSYIVQSRILKKLFDEDVIFS